MVNLNKQFDNCLIFQNVRRGFHGAGTASIPDARITAAGGQQQDRDKDQEEEEGGVDETCLDG